MKKIAHVLLGFGLAGCLALLPLPAGHAASEDTLKASYLHKFTKFVEWPPPLGERFLFCILGDDKIGLFTDTLEGKRAQGHDITLANARRHPNLRGCQVLYIDAAESWRAGVLIQELRGQPVLTISDAPGFAAQGGMIELLREGDHLRFAINRTAALAAGLKFSAPLIELAVRLY